MQTFTEASELVSRV